MAGVNVKMGVSGIAQFKRDMGQAQSAVKTLDQQLKLNEASFRAGGDAQVYMQQKTQILTRQFEAQKRVVESAQKALTEMKNKGVDPTSTAYQTMQQKLFAAQTELLAIDGKIKNVGQDTETAGKNTSTLNTELGKIGKGVSWENVANGIGKINDQLENAGRTAIRIGKTIARSAMDASGWADDILTRSTQYGVDPETLQKMENVAAYIDTDVDVILTARSKLMRGVGNGTKGTMDALEALGISYNGNAEDTFWQAGQMLANLGDEAEQESLAFNLFGRSWRDLLPLFTAGRQTYESMMDQQNVLTTEQVQKLGEADDAFKSVTQQVELLKRQFWAEHAPVIIDALTWVVDNKDAVVTALTAIGIAFGGMKIAEFAANVGRTVAGLKEIQALKAAKDVATTATGGTTATSGGGIGLTGAAGLAGLGAIIAGFAWASHERRTNENIRGSEGAVEQAAGGNTALEDAFVRYISAEKALDDFINSTDYNDDDANAFVDKVEAMKTAFFAMEGAGDMMKSYSDWRQENGYGSADWVIPERYGTVPDGLSDSADSMNGASRSMDNAAATMRNLPAWILGAVRNGVSNIVVTLDGQKVGNLTAPYVSQHIAREIM